MAEKWLLFPGCLFVLISFWVSQANSDASAKIGVIYKGEDSALYNLMKSVYNKRTGVELIGVQTQSEDLLTRAVMKKLSGAVIVFDLSFVDQRSFILADILMVPVISMKPIFEEIDFQFPVSSRPHYMKYAQGIVDVLNYFIPEGQNEGVTIVYEAGYSRLATKISALAMKKGRFSVDIIPELPFNRPERRAKALDVLRKLQTRYVVAICHPSNLQWIMEKVTRLGVINKKSRWFAVDMELSGNISSPSLKGLVGLRLSFKDEAAEETSRDKIKQENIPIKPGLELNYAILRDTLSAVLEVFNGTPHGTFQMEVADKECPLEHRTDTKGTLMFEKLSNVTIDGLTGLIKFDPKLRRRNVTELGIVNIKELENGSENEIVQVGTWREEERKGGPTVKLMKDDNINWNGEFWMQCEVEVAVCDRSPSTDRRHLVVATRIDEPFCLEKENGYEGFSVDLLDEIAGRMSFSYTLKIFNGSADMIAALRHKEVDIAIGAITINAKRQKKIDFSKPFMNFRVGMILPKPEAEDVNVFAFLLPFDSYVWLCIIISAVTVTLFVYFLDRLSPYGYHAQAEQSDPAKGGDELNLFNSLWFTTGSILGQGAEDTPRTASGRILAGAFWFFTLILVSTYTANLAAYFTAKSTTNTIKSLEDLVAQKKIKYGLYKDGSIHDFFKSSSVSPYKEMNYNMQTYDGAFVNSTKAGVDKVLKGDFAYLTDQPYLDYYNKKFPCNTTLVKHLLETKGYGIALQRNSDLTNCFSVAILELVEKETIKKLRERWWTDSGDSCQGDKTKAVTKSPLRLELHNVAGVFIILLAGMGASFLLLLVERRCGNLRDLAAEKGVGQTSLQAIRSVLRPNDEVQPGKVFVNNTEVRPPVRHPDQAERANCKAVYDKKLASAYANAPESKV